MKQIRLLLQCDYCAKEEKSNQRYTEESKFKTYPVMGQWIYLLDFQWMDRVDMICKRKDLHFCSKKCIMKYLEQEVFDTKKNHERELIEIDRMSKELDEMEPL